MTGSTLIRRAAAATIGVQHHPARARALPLVQGPTLARRAAAAVIGVRICRPPAPANAEAAAQGAAARSAGDSAPSAPTPLVTLGAPAAPRGRERPRRGLVLVTAAAVMAIAFGAYTYHQDTSPDMAHPAGAVPQEYLGTWTATIKKDDTRTLMIRQGDVGDTVMSLTANGPLADGATYRCVFTAQLDSVTLSDIRLSNSTAASAKPAEACQASGSTMLTLVGENQLRRVTDESQDSVTYTRSP